MAGALSRSGVAQVERQAVCAVFNLTTAHPSPERWDCTLITSSGFVDLLCGEAGVPCHTIHRERAVMHTLKRRQSQAAVALLAGALLILGGCATPSTSLTNAATDPGADQSAAAVYVA